MGEHKAHLEWELKEGDFLRGRFSRQHAWRFDGGLEVPASASPAVVPEPLSNPQSIDPEEAFVASISSCHMLTFLYLAARKGFLVRRYTDDAVGVTVKTENGSVWVSAVVLRPQIEYENAHTPSETEEVRLHEAAHAQCFIANSVKTEIRVEAATGRD